MICEKDKCTGCFACWNSCPCGAIEMVEDDFGYVYPIIIEEKCIKCGLCKKVCPSINEIEYNEVNKCYAMIAKDKVIHENSTSGGAATTFARFIIQEKQGVVYGAAYEKNKVQHIRVENYKDLYKLQGSKYVHSYIGDIYKQIKADLILDKYVLFVGTPCQISGLIKFLGKKYDNLFTIDLICHGVPSQKFLKEEIEGYNINLDFDNILFRSLDGFKIKLLKNNKLIYENEMENSLYYLGFMKALFYRDNCYSCLYAKPERVSDITIGDFWGLDKTSELYKHKDIGVSVLLINTSKGEDLINFCKDRMVLEERICQEAINGNDQLRSPAIKHKGNVKFKNKYKKYGLEKSIKCAMKYEILKKYLKRNKIISYIYRRVKG